MRNKEVRTSGRPGGVVKELKGSVQLAREAENPAWHKLLRMPRRIVNEKVPFESKAAAVVVADAELATVTATNVYNVGHAPAMPSAKQNPPNHNNFNCRRFLALAKKLRMQH